MFIKAALALVLSLVLFTTMASQAYIALEERFTAEQMHATGLDTLSAKQLKLLNQLLQQDLVKTAEAAQANAPIVDQQRSRASFIGLNDQPIKSRLKGTASSWEPGTVFELENGQQWKVLKGAGKLRTPVDSPEIIVVPGIAGRWFFQINEDMPRPRVYLIN